VPDNGASRRADLAKDTIRGDRRLQRRYPIELDLEYRIIENGTVVSTGDGKTGNMSSGGILFRSQNEVTEGSVELLIRWPAILGNTPFVELCVFGRVVRSDADGIAVRTARYQFQKLGNPAHAFHQLFGHALVQ